MLWNNKLKFTCFATLLIIFLSSISVNAKIIDSYNDKSNPDKVNTLKFDNPPLRYELINIANESTKISYPVITQAEQKVFGKTSENEDIYIRVDRLEKSLFTGDFSKSDLADRVDKIREKTQDNGESSNYTQSYEPNENKNDNILDKLFDAEINILGSSFEDESPDERLAKLEKVIFGYNQNGTIKSRINQIYEISKTSSNRYNNQTKNSYESYNTPEPKRKNSSEEMTAQYRNNESYSTPKLPHGSTSMASQGNFTQSYNTPEVKTFFESNSPQTYNNSYSAGNNNQNKNNSVIETLKQIAYPFALYFLSKSSAGNNVPSQLINEFFGNGNPNYNNYQSYPQKQYLPQY